MHGFKRGITSRVEVLCREYTVEAYSIPFSTKAVSTPVFRVPNGGFITIVSNSVNIARLEVDISRASTG